MHNPKIGMVEGTTGSCGRVEVYLTGRGWGTVCDDNVVCRQLGYSRASSVYQSAHFGEGSGPILLDDVECTGNEKYLWECPHRGWGEDDCSHGEDAGVYCA